MKIEEIKNQLDQSRPEIVAELSKDGWKHFSLYLRIQKKYLANSLDEDFQRAFSLFYILNGPGGFTETQKAEFFRLLAGGQADLRKILETLYEIPGYINSHRLFLSFATKLLHTQDTNLPIYDRNIADILNLPTQATTGSLQNRLDIYQKLKDDYAALMSDSNVVRAINEIRIDLRKQAALDAFEWDDEHISDVKLLDSSLWALYTIGIKRKKQLVRQIISIGETGQYIDLPAIPERADKAYAVVERGIANELKIPELVRLIKGFSIIEHAKFGDFGIGSPTPIKWMYETLRKKVLKNPAEEHLALLRHVADWLNQTTNYYRYDAGIKIDSAGVESKHED